VRGGSNDRVAVVFSWQARDGSRPTWAQVVKLKAGKIVDMQDYANPARAFRAVGA